MRNRPNLDKDEAKKFIESAAGELGAKGVVKEDFHQYVKKTSWPIVNASPNPSLAEGSELKKPLLVNLNEKEWKSIDRHTKALGVSKQEWLRHAIYCLLEEEQNHFFSERNG